MSFFTGEDQVTKPADSQTPDSQTNEDWMKKVVEQKGDSFADPQAVAKGYLAAQSHIDKLEREQAEMREDLAKSTYAKELLEELQKGKPNSGEPASHNTGGTATETTTPNVSETDLKSLINETLTERESQNTARQNLEETDRKLNDLFGTEVNKVMESKGKEFGMSKEQMRELAAKSPSALLTLLGEKPKQETNLHTDSTVNTSAGFMSQNSGERNWAYYQKLRKENPNLYYTPKIQNQMEQDYAQLGDKFKIN